MIKKQLVGLLWWSSPIGPDKVLQERHSQSQQGTMPDQKSFVILSCRTEALTGSQNVNLKQKAPGTNGMTS